MSPLLRIATLALACAAIGTATGQDCFTAIANPGEDASTQARLNWHSSSTGSNTCYVTLATDAQWSNQRKFIAHEQLITVFDSLPSKDKDGNDIIECPHFIRCALSLDSLMPGEKYMYKVGSEDSEIRYFKTAPQPNQPWTAAIISDFHAYLPNGGRQASAMAMLDTLKSVNGGDFDMLLSVGDVCAWGGSYSFWQNLYDEPNFRQHLVAGVVGNHDYQSSGYEKDTNEFFRYANNNPDNGYDQQMGVCYHFTYVPCLFIMLNGECMATGGGLERAKVWIRDVLKHNDAKYVVLMEHYQWFYGKQGKDAQYARWQSAFAEMGIDLAIGGNNHIYVRSHPLRNGKVATDGKGTICVQTPSSDNERGDAMGELTNNAELIAARWTEGHNTVGAMLMRYDGTRLTLTLYNRHGTPIDTVSL